MWLFSLTKRSRRLELARCPTRRRHRQRVLPPWMPPSPPIRILRS